ncbi:dickkopf-related protein 4 [Odontesthes bonariensis]|uniref:dickkopf-related protein 4 n=1 Tax=Odontesthes bonariensis TaxID=219752 RepID=UPI003F581148
MWLWRSVLCVSLVCGLALDSNTIRSSKEVTQPEAEPPTGGCSNRAQRRPASDRHVVRQTNRHVDRQTDGLNRTKAPEMSSCVRSGDCAAGLCCVRYLTGKRCQRIPEEGEACLLRGPTKLRRNLGRCDCAAGLSCAAAAAAEGAEPGKNKRQGVCLPRPRQGQRKTRHSGGKRTAADSRC